MKLLIQNIVLPITASEAEVFDVAKARLTKHFPANELSGFAVHKKSVDARKKDRISFVYSVYAEVAREAADTDALLADGIVPSAEHPFSICFGSELLSARPVIVGFGPCGMFCALLLAANGYRPIVIERGADVAERTVDVERFFRFGVLNPDSNIQFGAGGAGTFSDGKLVTRIGDPKCGYVLSEMARFGAPREILTKAKPHIGTDYLKKVVANVALEIERLGGEIHYHTKLTDIRLIGNRAEAVVTNHGEIACGALILALGHSARETFSMLRSHGVPMTPKAFSVGVRIEHLQADIDRALYGNFAGDPLLPKGEYALSAHQPDGRGVYTFCMCPGGEVVGAASEAGGVVTNGMSSYARDGKNANSAVAVSVLPADYGEAVERAIAFQRDLEERAYQLGGRTYEAPCETVGSFLGKTGKAEPSRVLPTYRGGKVRVTSLDALYPTFVSETLKFGISQFDRKIRGFAAEDAVLTGPETRTSSPIRIPRSESGVAENFDNLYPCGEGAGYAGGITSAAVDGIDCALAVIARYQRDKGGPADV